MRYSTIIQLYYRIEILWRRLCVFLYNYTVILCKGNSMETFICYSTIIQLYYGNRRVWRRLCVILLLYSYIMEIKEYGDVYALFYCYTVILCNENVVVSTTYLLKKR